MGHNGGVVHASEMCRGITFSLIKDKAINGCYKFCSPGSTAAAVCAHVFVCACARMCVMSFITQVQLAGPRVPGTVQCLGTKRADETAFCWQSEKLGHLWSSIPEGKLCESKHPEEQSTRTRIVLTHTQTCWTMWWSHQNRRRKFTQFSTNFCLYLYICEGVYVWKRNMKLPLGCILLKQCYLYNYTGPNGRRILVCCHDPNVIVDLVIIFVQVWRFEASVCRRQNVYLCPLDESLFLKRCCTKKNFSFFLSINVNLMLCLRWFIFPIWGNGCDGTMLSTKASFINSAASAAAAFMHLQKEANTRENRKTGVKYSFILLLQSMERLTL